MICPFVWHLSLEKITRKDRENLNYNIDCISAIFTILCLNYSPIFVRMDAEFLVGTLLSHYSHPHCLSPPHPHSPPHLRTWNSTLPKGLSFSLYLPLICVWMCMGVCMWVMYSGPLFIKYNLHVKNPSFPPFCPHPITDLTRKPKRILNPSHY